MKVDGTMLALPAELTQRQAAAASRGLVRQLRAQAASPRQAVLVDASALARFDTSALAVLLECRREALALGQDFAVKTMPPRLRELAELYGVTQLLPAAPVEAAPGAA